MKRQLVATGALLVLCFAGSGNLWAQHYGCGSGYRGYSSPGISLSIGYGNYGGYRSYNSGYSGYGGNQGYGGYSGYGGGYPNYGGHVHRSWHDTSHLDYHGPSLIRHRGHYDVVPGHYDVHRTGHWDYHGH